MPQCQFHVSAILCFRKATQEIFSELDETKAKVLIFPKHDGVQSRDGGEPGGSHATPRPRQGQVWAPCPLPFAALPPIYSPRWENLKPQINFPRNILQAATIIDARLGGSRSSSRHPAREGNHHRRSSSSPCLPLE
jgi:hypothetical protein